MEPFKNEGIVICCTGDSCNMSVMYIQLLMICLNLLVYNILTDGLCVSLQGIPVVLGLVELVSLVLLLFGKAEKENQENKIRVQEPRKKVLKLN